MTYLSDCAIERVAFKPQLLLHPLALLLFVVVILIVALKLQIMDGVTKVVPVLVIFEIGNEFVDVHVVCLERAPGRQVNVADDLVDSQTT